MQFALAGCSRWVDRLELLLVAALHELSIDVKTNWLGILAPVGGSELDEEI